MHLVDDWGWANAGWHRPDGDNETSTPVMDGLVRGGVELDRAYAYRFCSPSRCSLQSGRLPVHVNTKNDPPTDWNPADPVSGFAGIPRNMTCVAEKLRRAGYRTHQVGKWHAGFATVDHTPHGRGYETSFGYFQASNGYFDETDGPQGGSLVDLWNTTHPAYGANSSCSAAKGECRPAGTAPLYMVGPEDIYEERKFADHIVALIAAHDPGEPLFLNYDSHIAHSPLQVPEHVYRSFSWMTDDWDHHRQLYTSMVAYLDVQVGRVVGALKGRGMWPRTLWVCQSDNGGPSFSGDNHTANNYPLRGAKYTNWEGGIRTNAFVAGGFVASEAPARVGAKLTGFVHVADWYATFCALSGATPDDPRAAAAGLPPPDSADLWPYLSGAAAASPRVEFFADHGVLFSGRYKLFNADKVVGACFPGPVYPNASQASWAGAKCPAEQPCANGGCLYDVYADPTEHADLSGDAAHAATLAAMQRRLAQLAPTRFEPVRKGGDKTLAKAVAHARYGGYWGPFVFP